MHSMELAIIFVIMLAVFMGPFFMNKKAGKGR